MQSNVVVFRLSPAESSSFTSLEAPSVSRTNTGSNAGFGVLVLPKGQTIQVLPSIGAHGTVSQIVASHSHPGVAAQVAIQAQVSHNVAPKNAFETIIAEIETIEAEWHGRNSEDADQGEERGKKSKKRASRGRVELKINPKAFFSREYTSISAPKKRKFLAPKKTLLAKLKKHLRVF